VWGIWIFVVPSSLIVDNIEGSVKAKDLALKVNGFEKGLVFNFSAEGIELLSSGKRIIAAEDVRGRIDLLDLPFLRLTVPVEGSIGGGGFEGKISVGKKRFRMDLSVQDAPVDESLLAYAGIGGKGVLSSELHLEDGAGAVKISLADADLESLTLPDAYVPLDMFRGARGMAEIKGGVISVSSFALEGEGIYARLKGKIEGGRLDMLLELMPERALDQTVEALIEPHKVTEGYYAIPVKRDL
jgi:type II secretion system protein N